jgi:hypothetical protein
MRTIPDDLVDLVFAHVALKERLSVCMVVSKAFRGAAQRHGWLLQLRRSSTPVQLLSPPQWMSDSVTIWSTGRISHPLTSMRPSSLCLDGFDASDELLRAMLSVRRVTRLELKNCKGQAVAWHAALMGGAWTVLTWDNPAVPVEVATSSIASCRALERLTIRVCLMPQSHPFTQAQLRNAFLPIGALAAIPSLRQLTLLEGPRDGEGESDEALFGYSARYIKNELDCNEDVIVGLILGLSALHQVQSIDTDMLGDWAGDDTATAMALMLAALPELQELGTPFFLRAKTWETFRMHLAYHPSLRRLRLRYSEPDESDLVSMAHAIGTWHLLPQLRELELELMNTNIEVHEVARQLEGLQGLRTLHALHIEWDEREGLTRTEIEGVFSGLAHSVTVCLC